MFDFSALHLAIFGPGLLGGSLVRDARAHGAASIRVWARREATLSEVRECGLLDFSSTDATEVAEGANLLVLCVPVGAMPGLAMEIVKARLGPHVLITDVGSVKGMVMRDVAPIFANKGVAFIGSHPMAGGEKGGFAESRTGLFEEAACILTPPENSNAEMVAKLHYFWQALGSKTSTMTTLRHDEVVARISHLPRVAAAATVLSAFLPDPTMADYAAGGLRDTTRVAAGDPAMWQEILLLNREAVLPTLRDLRDAADAFVKVIENSDATALQALLAEARSLRALRYPN